MLLRSINLDFSILKTVKKILFISLLSFSLTLSFSPSQSIAKDKKQNSKSIKQAQKKKSNKASKTKKSKKSSKKSSKNSRETPHHSSAIRNAPIKSDMTNYSSIEEPIESTNQNNSQNNNSDPNNYEELSKVDYLMLMDRDTGEVLLEKNADERLSPSSMTKLMTSYVVFNEAKKGHIKLENQCLIGRDAWKKYGSSMFLNYGDVVSIDQLVSGLLAVSGNDAAMALAESISGSIKDFAKLMNDTADEIGLRNSRFKNPHGLNEDGHYMTLRDLANLTRHIAKDFPQHLHYYSIRSFTYNHITQINRNPLLKSNYEGATGMKTGYTSDGGYGMVGTATRNNRHLIAITNNAVSPAQRQRVIIQLLNYGFNNFEKVTFFIKDETIAKANVWLGTQAKVDLIAKDDIAMTIAKNQTIDDIEFEVKYKDPLFTPIFKGQELGKLIINISGKKFREIPLYAKENVQKAGYMDRMWKVFRYKLDNMLEKQAK